MIAGGSLDVSFPVGISGKRACSARLIRYSRCPASFVGLLVGQTGMGGGALMTPLLILLFGVPPATAVGTDLLYASATKTVGTLVHGLNHTVRWRIVGLLAPGSVPATALTLLVISQFDISGSAASGVISCVLGVMLC